LSVSPLFSLLFNNLFQIISFLKLSIDSQYGSCLKIKFWFKIKAGERSNPQEYCSILSLVRLWRQLEREPNKDIGPKDIFETVSI